MPQDLPLPETLIARTRRRGEAQARWLDELPAIVDATARRWRLTLEPHFANLSYNYVAPARLSGGEPAVLKACFVERGFLAEVEALRCWEGRGAVRLLDADTDLGVVLLERLEPGLVVSSLADDEAETALAAEVMRALHGVPIPQDHDLIPMQEWLDGIAERAVIHQARGFRWLDNAVRLAADLMAAPGQPVLLHGDLHHDNILSSRRGWLAIDPKGVIGEPAWECGTYLYNNLPDDGGETAWRRIVRRRADQLAEALQLDRQLVHACCAVYAVLSAAWSLDIDAPLARLSRRLVTADELAGL